MWKIAAIVFLVLIVVLVIAIVRYIEGTLALMRSQRKIMKQCADSCHRKKFQKQECSDLDIKKIADAILDVQIISNLAERVMKDNIRITKENEKLREMLEGQANQ